MKGTAFGDRRAIGLTGVGLLAAAGILAVLFLAALSLGWNPGISVQDIEDRILSWGPWGVAGSIGLMVLHSFLPFPVLMVIMGDNIDPLAWEWWVLLLVAAVALWFAVRRKLAPPPGPSSGPSSGPLSGTGASGKTGLSFEP